MRMARNSSVLPEPHCGPLTHSTSEDLDHHSPTEINTAVITEGFGFLETYVA